MTTGTKQRLVANRSEKGFGVIQYFVVGGAGIAIAAIALTEAQLPLPKISSGEFGQISENALARAPSKLDGDYRPTAETVARVHQSEIGMVYNGDSAGPAPQIALDQQSTVAPPAASLRLAPATASLALTDNMASLETRVKAEGIAVGARLSIMELTEEFEFDESLIASIDVELSSVSLPQESLSQLAEAEKSAPASFAAIDEDPPLGFGVMELTAEFELDDRLLTAATRPVDMQMSKPAFDPAPVAASTPASMGLARKAVPASELVLSESDSAPFAEVMSETRSARAGSTRHTLSQKLRAFDLAQIGSAPAAGHASALNQVIELQKPVRSNGMALGNVDLRISGNSTIEIRLSSILSLLRDQMEPALFDRLNAANNVGTYVTFADLRAAGIRINFDPVLDMLTMSANAS